MTPRPPEPVGPTFRPRHPDHVTTLECPEPERPVAPTFRPRRPDHDTTHERSAFQHPEELNPESQPHQPDHITTPQSRRTDVPAPTLNPNPVGPTLWPRHPDHLMEPRPTELVGPRHNAQMPGPRRPESPVDSTFLNPTPQPRYDARTAGGPTPRSAQPCATPPRHDAPTPSAQPYRSYVPARTQRADPVEQSKS